MEEIVKKSKFREKYETKKGFRIFIICVFIILLVIVLSLLANTFSALSLRFYIDRIGSVEYDEGKEIIVPVKEEEGYYTFRTDGDLNIMEINDIHIGCGRYSLKKDKKSIYEVMNMVKKEKPDLIILNGDNTFCVPGPIFNGGGTFNNKMAAKTIIHMFETLGVYWTTAFGNHDTEAFDYYNRGQIAKFYSKDKWKYCIFESNYDEYGKSNQCVLVKNKAGKITKALMVIDSNDYIDDSLSASINWQYDIIHDCQAEWAKKTLDTLSAANGSKVKGIFFFHIPVGEYETAYRELLANNWAPTTNSEYVSGVWDELVDEDMGGRIWYGGCSQTDKKPEDVDNFFEILGPDGADYIEAIVCGHDHVNNAVVKYKGVYLIYGNSIDNLAYDGINKIGIQRGALVIDLKSDGTWTQVHKNAYKDYGVSTNKFYKVDTDKYLYEDYVPKN